MNKYEGLHCPVCRGKLFEDDDIAVCPDCGAPHHRYCYNFEGHCHFEDKHNTDEQWQMPKHDHTEHESNNIAKCPACGQETSPNALFCPKCGFSVNSNHQDRENPFGNQSGANPFGGQPFMGGYFYTGAPINENDEIDGIKASEIAAFIGLNSPRYLNIFKRMSVTKSKTSWSWMAFLVPEYWLISRKCYKLGSLALAIKLIISTIISVLGISSNLLNRSVGPSSIIDTLEMMSSNEFLILMVISIVIIATSVLFGLLGDYIYKRKVFSSINKLKSDGKVDSFMLAQAGGVNLYLPVIAYFLVTIIQQFVINLI